MHSSVVQHLDEGEVTARSVQCKRGGAVGTSPSRCAECALASYGIIQCPVCPDILTNRLHCQHDGVDGRVLWDLDGVEWCGEDRRRTAHVLHVDKDTLVALGCAWPALLCHQHKAEGRSLPATDGGVSDQLQEHYPPVAVPGHVEVEGGGDGGIRGADVVVLGGVHTLVHVRRQVHEPRGWGGGSFRNGQVDSTAREGGGVVI